MSPFSLLPSVAFVGFIVLSFLEIGLSECGSSVCSLLLLLFLFFSDRFATLVGETAVCGCHCPRNLAVRMREVLARQWVGVYVPPALRLHYFQCNLFKFDLYFISCCIS